MSLIRDDWFLTIFFFLTSKELSISSGRRLGCVGGQQCPERVVVSSRHGAWWMEMYALSGRFCTLRRWSQQVPHDGTHTLWASWRRPEIHGGEGLCRGLSYWREKAVSDLWVISTSWVSLLHGWLLNNWGSQNSICISILASKPISIQCTL